MIIFIVSKQKKRKKNFTSKHLFHRIASQRDAKFHNSLLKETPRAHTHIMGNTQSKMKNKSIYVAYINDTILSSFTCSRDDIMEDLKRHKMEITMHIMKECADTHFTWECTVNTETQFELSLYSQQRFFFVPLHRHLTCSIGFLQLTHSSNPYSQYREEQAEADEADEADEEMEDADDEDVEDADDEDVEDEDVEDEDEEDEDAEEDEEDEEDENVEEDEEVNEESVKDVEDDDLEVVS